MKFVKNKWGANIVTWLFKVFSRVPEEKMDGVAGLEPAHDRIKIYWLTNLPIPHLRITIFIDRPLINQGKVI